MLAPSPVVKKTANTALSGHWLQASAVSCVLIFAFFIGELSASLISIVAGKVGFIIFFIAFLIFALSPLALGVLYWFRRLLWGQNDETVTIFRYFSSLSEYKRALHFILILTCKLGGAAVILLLPSFIVWMLSSERFYVWFDIPFPVWTSSLGTLNSFLIIIAVFALLFIALKYYLAPFLFISDDDIHPAEAVNMSTVISKRTGADFFGLVLSFIGWIILSLFIAPLIFTVPYFWASCAVHCRFAVTAYNRDVERFNNNNTPHYTVDEV